jgi:pilus assembly protein CpaE
MSTHDSTLSALMISPNREISDAFLRAATTVKCFQVLSDLKSYLPEQVLEMRLRQWKPDLVLLDLTTDINEACEIIRYLVNRNPPVQIVGLHTTQDADAIVRSLRAGATEFLWSPFEPSAQEAACERLIKLRAPVDSEEREEGTVIGFASTKPGSGASTLAAQTSFALQRLSHKKVLLLDMDLLGGTISFYLKIQHSHSLADLLQQDEPLTRSRIASVVAHMDGVDILPSPDEPLSITIDPARLRVVIESFRKLYDFVILDLPAIFHRTSLLGLAETDTAYLVTTAELPSLHLTRKAIEMLTALGFERTRYGIIVNRLNRNEGIGTGDFEKMFGSSVRAAMPNDYFSLHRVVTRGEPLPGEGELGRAIQTLAGKLGGFSTQNKPKPKSFVGVTPALSRT